MTRPISFSPAPISSEKRIAAPTVARRDSAQPVLPQRHASTPSLPLSKLTEAARRLAAEGPPVDNLRIAQIRRAIASGDYRIDAVTIADAILRRVPISTS